MRNLAVMAVLCAILAQTSLAKLYIDVGTHALKPDQADQTVEVYVTGGDSVQGLEFYAQIANGAYGPLFESADILTGTIFAANNNGLFDGSYVDPRRLYQGVVTHDGGVSAEGLLAILKIDTTGVYDGTYRLSLTNDLEERTTNFTTVPVDVADGWIVIPEPASVLLLAAGVGVVRRGRASGARNRG